MAARDTLVFLVLPWTEKATRCRSKKEARRYAESLLQEWKALDLEVTEDSDGDFVVQERD